MFALCLRYVCDMFALSLRYTDHVYLPYIVLISDILWIPRRYLIPWDYPETTFGAAMNATTTRSESTSSILLRLPTELHARLSAHAASRTTPVSVLLRQILIDHLESLEPRAKPTHATQAAAEPQKPVPAAPKRSPEPNPGPELLAPEGPKGADAFKAAFYWHLENLGIHSQSTHSISRRYGFPESIVINTIKYGLEHRGLPHMDVPEHTIDGVRFPARPGMVPMTTRERMIVCREGGEALPEDRPEAFELQEPAPIPRAIDPVLAAKLENLFDDVDDADDVDA